MKPTQMIKLGMLALLASTTLTSAFAQNSTGNGGGAHYCKGVAQQEMYDVFEGRMRYALEYSPAYQSMTEEQIIDQAIAKMRTKNITLADDIAKQIQYLSLPENFRILSNINLKIVNDANILMTEKGCEYAQLANWDDTIERVFIDKQIYSQMNSLNRAALKLHEAIYKTSRVRIKETTSDRVRKLVAQLLSTGSFDETFLKIDPDTRNSGNSKMEMKGLYFHDTSSGINDYTVDAKISIGKTNVEQVGKNLGSLKITYVRGRDADNKVKAIQEKLANPNLTKRERKTLQAELAEAKRDPNYGFALFKCFRSDISVDDPATQQMAVDSHTCVVPIAKPYEQINMYFANAKAFLKGKYALFEFEFTKYDGTVIKDTQDFQVRSAFEVNLLNVTTETDLQ